MFNPRPKQADVLRFRKGRMGVSAVPGSGKTQTLSYLAANLIAESRIGEDQEVLIVTLVNSAVDNFSSRVRGFVEDFGLLPGLGYRVRTLHGLAHDIVRERPDLAGLSERFQIVDEREAGRILQDSVNNWLRVHPELFTQYGDPDHDPSRNPRLQKSWLEQIIQIANSFISQAKDLRTSPAEIYQRLQALESPQPLLEMGCDIYASYQQSLHYRTAIDFNDLIRLAYQALSSDPKFLERLQERWPYILEDEAQDSSRVQEDILRLLTGKHGNWVRVGDPNQAIYETFTTANPQFLLDFLNEKGVSARELPNSGRSTHSIITLANHLIEWTRERHPNPALRQALALPLIRPTPPGDPQPNPPDKPHEIHLYPNKLTPDKELDLVAKSVRNWLETNPDKTAAVLVPRNERGAKIVDELKKYGVRYVELLRSSLSTRQTANLLSLALRCLAEPASSNRLSNLYRQMTHNDEDDEIKRKFHQNISRLIRRCSHLEEYLWPLLEQDWLTDLSELESQETINALIDFRDLIRRWHNASQLPVDQLVLTIAQDLFGLPADLALSHKLALVLEGVSNAHPDWHLPQFVQELETIAQNQRKFTGFSEEDTGFDPDQHRGEVVIATVHKAKGLEWDRVYLLSVNNYDYPSAEQYDQYIGEKYFVRDHLNLQAEAISRLKALLGINPEMLDLPEGTATLEDRIKYAEERIRLLYVGITRAREELVVTWNTGQRGESKPALPFTALQAFWKGENHAQDS